MSREIKFRVWSEEDRKYRTDCNLTRLFNSVTGTPATIYSDEGGRFDIEQYTGLKDKNGKEIYEGDIIETVDDWGYKKHSFAVGWHDPFACFHLYYLDGRPSAFAINYVANIGKVIGNIHENPELLGGKA